jgi:hypothetical protein
MHQSFRVTGDSARAVCDTKNAVDKNPTSLNNLQHAIAKSNRAIDATASRLHSTKARIDESSSRVKRRDEPLRAIFEVEVPQRSPSKGSGPSSVR